MDKIAHDKYDPKDRVTLNYEFFSYLRSNYDFVFLGPELMDQTMRGFPVTIDHHQFEPWQVHEC